MFHSIFLATLLSLASIQSAPKMKNLEKLSDCVFPFTYRGKTYEACTKVDEPRHWCSKTSVYEGKWRYCPRYAKTMKTKPRKPHRNKSHKPKPRKPKPQKHDAKSRDDKHKPNGPKPNGHKPHGHKHKTKHEHGPMTKPTAKKPAKRTRKTRTRTTTTTTTPLPPKRTRKTTFPTTISTQAKTTTTTTTKTTPVETGQFGCGVNKYNNPFIQFVVGGVTSLKEKWIWQAGISYYGQFSCGGTLIAPQYVLTAAHCLNNGDNLDKDGLEIILGDHDRELDEATEQRFTIERYWIHQSYRDPTGIAMNADIALIKLSRPAKLNRAVGIACLPPAYVNVHVVDSKCYISGWGKMLAEGDPANLLQEAKLPLQENSECGLRNKDISGLPLVNKSMLCAGNYTGTSSGCQGDSGGPLVCKNKARKWVLQGVVSWGSAKCDNQEFYTVFTRVSQYVNWIKARMT